MLGTPGPQDGLHRITVLKIFRMLQYRYHHENEKCRYGRSVWAIFIAAIETQDPVQRKWLLERLNELRDLTGECEWLCSTAKEILRVQTEPGVPWVDFAEYIKP